VTDNSPCLPWIVQLSLEEAGMQIDFVQEPARADTAITFIPPSHQGRVFADKHFGMLMIRFARALTFLSPCTP